MRMRVPVIGLLLLFSAPQIHSAVNVRNHYFRLALPGDWALRKGEDPEQFVFISAARSAQVTISVLPMNAKGKNLEQITDKLLEVRLAAERKTAADRQIFFSAPWRSMPAGGGIQINYMGHDSLGRYFFYSGFVTETGITSVTGELVHSNEPALRDFYKEVLNNFGY
jgi:hypothetical protein